MLASRPPNDDIVKYMTKRDYVRLGEIRTRKTSKTSTSVFFVFRCTVFWLWGTGCFYALYGVENIKDAKRGINIEPYFYARSELEKFGIFNFLF
jgi:hypothetical protein